MSICHIPNASDLIIAFIILRIYLSDTLSQISLKISIYKKTINRYFNLCGNIYIQLKAEKKPAELTHLKYVYRGDSHVLP